MALFPQDSHKNSHVPFTQSWYDYQKSALGESACRQLGFFVLPDNFLLSVVIPFFNEEQTLLEIVSRVVKIPIRKEIILINDGSTDRSETIANEIALKLADEHNSIRTIVHSTKLGKGASLRDGFKIVSGDVVICQDADLEYDPEDFPRLIQPIIESDADVVYGSRFLKQEGGQAGYFSSYLGNRVITMMSNVFTNLNLTDVETCYKAFRRETLETILPKLTSNDFAIEPEITIRISQAKFRVYEVPISYHPRTYADGKKIKWQDGFAAIWAIVKFGLFR